MDKKIRGAIVSIDPEFRAGIRNCLRDDVRGVEIISEVTLPFDRIGSGELAQLRESSPDVVFLDLESGPAIGMRFAQCLVERTPNRRVVAAGPPLSPELLLEAMRAGISEYLPKPISREALAAAVERMVRKLAAAPGEGPRQPGEIMAVFSPKGGSGSTTVATNLAVHLHLATGKRTLLLDLDLELGEVAVLLGVQPRFSFVDMIRNFHRMDAELLASYIEQDETGVHLLSAPFHPESAETVTGDAIRRILGFLRQHYDYVVVDTSKSFSPPTLAAFQQADRILLVTTVDLASIRNIKRCMPLLDRIVGAGTERVQLVVNRYNANDPITVDEVEKTLGIPCRWKLANDYEVVIQSINSGKPAVHDAKSSFARDLIAMGTEIGGLRAQPPAARRLGPIAKLFAWKGKEAPAHG